MPSLSDAPAMTVGSCSSSSLLTFSGSARLNEQEMRPGPIRRGSSVAWILLCCIPISICCDFFFFHIPFSSTKQHKKRQMKKDQGKKGRERKKKLTP